MQVSEPVKLRQDTKYLSMYRLEWEDEVLSEDFYNKTRANDILKNYAEYRYHMKKRDPRFNNLRAFVRAETL